MDRTRSVLEREELQRVSSLLERANSNCSIHALTKIGKSPSNPIGKSSARLYIYDYQPLASHFQRRESWFLDSTNYHSMLGPLLGNPSAASWPPRGLMR
jgi:hypothetical protein